MLWMNHSQPRVSQVCLVDQAVMEFQGGPVIFIIPECAVVRLPSATCPRARSLQSRICWPDRGPRSPEKSERGSLLDPAGQAPGGTWQLSVYGGRKTPQPDTQMDALLFARAGAAMKASKSHSAAITSKASLLLAAA